MEIVTVNLSQRSYPVYIGQDFLGRVGRVATDFHLGPKVLLVSDDQVYEFYGEKVRTSLQEAGFCTSLARVPPGEIYKSLSQAIKLYEACVKSKLDRDSTIMGMGGGVVGDLTGFVASTYLRGVDFVLLPTTLLAQLDSSIGGKVGVDLPQGKNLVGSFYQPRFVYTDLKVLKTLSWQQVKEGLAEVVKYGVIKDAEFFDWVEKNLERIKGLDLEVLSFAVKRSVEIKAKVVESDERELKGLRQILNFGHTIGHAIEASSGYRSYTHGEAVALGMVGAARIAERMGYFPSPSAERLKSLLEAIGLPIRLEGVDEEKIWDALQLDKKVREDRLHFVLPRKIGQVFLTPEVSPRVIRKTLQDLKK
ncbi:MAG: 3-dehydroquinate synthase [bacterium]